MADRRTPTRIGGRQQGNVTPGGTSGTSPYIPQRRPVTPTHDRSPTTTSRKSPGPSRPVYEAADLRQGGGGGYSNPFGHGGVDAAFPPELGQPMPTRAATSSSARPNPQPRHASPFQTPSNRTDVNTAGSITPVATATGRQLFSDLQQIVVELSTRAIQDKKRISDLEGQLQQFGELVQSQEEMIVDLKRTNEALQSQLHHQAEQQQQRELYPSHHYAHNPPEPPQRPSSHHHPHSVDFSVADELKEERRQRMLVEEQHQRLFQEQQRSIRNLEARIRGMGGAGGGMTPNSSRIAGSDASMTPRNDRERSKLFPTRDRYDPNVQSSETIAASLKENPGSHDSPGDDDDDGEMRANDEDQQETHRREFHHHVVPTAALDDDDDDEDIKARKRDEESTENDRRADNVPALTEIETQTIRSIPRRQEFSQPSSRSASEVAMDALDNFAGDHGKPEQQTRIRSAPGSLNPHLLSPDGNNNNDARPLSLSSAQANQSQNGVRLHAPRSASQESDEAQEGQVNRPATSDPARVTRSVEVPELSNRRVVDLAARSKNREMAAARAAAQQPARPLGSLFSNAPTLRNASKSPEEAARNINYASRNALVAKALARAPASSSSVAYPPRPNQRQENRSVQGSNESAGRDVDKLLSSWRSYLKQ